jgi:3-oxoacyl-[acyl-carrier protein] reductase
MPHLEAAAAQHGDAAITIISSVSAAETQTANAYGALKAAQIHFAKGLAKEKARLHVRVNVVSPGTVYFKGGVWHQIEQGMPELFKTTMARNPTGRMATPQEIANAAVFLGSPVSAFTTGINLVVDGAITGRVNF